MKYMSDSWPNGQIVPKASYLNEKKKKKRNYCIFFLEIRVHRFIYVSSERLIE